jgi:phospholipase C
MTRNQWWKATCAFAATIGLLQPTVLLAAGVTPAVRVGPPSSALVAAHMVGPAAEPNLSAAQKLLLLQKNIKYVFVLFQENRSFDQHFGTFPGVDGLYPRNSKQPGFIQPIVNTDNTVGQISPFKIPNTVVNTAGATVQLYPADTDSVDHSHTGIVNSIHYSGGTTLSDRYALNEEGLTTDANGNIVSRATGAPLSSLPPPSLAAKQKAELVMSHLDCDTIPFLWQYADHFALFDNFHMTVTGPSTPNAIAMIAGQSGLTQWALHPSESAANVAGGPLAASGGLPVTADPGPYAGSNLDHVAGKPPYGPNDVSPATPTLNQTYASLPLSFMGSNINKIIAADENPAMDLLDVQADIATIASKNTAVNWGWYQEGYDHEPTDGAGAATNATYITHHNGPQYFGYLGDNTQVQNSNLHGLGDFYSAINSKSLKSGVYYVRGGYGNNDGLVPQDPTASIQANFAGSDDHPGYSDAQIAEALLADSVNAIANSQYWAHSAIIISYDETDGLYDHVPSAIRVNDSFGNPLSGGPRVPTIVISPYAATHTISSRYAEHSSIIKFIDELFNLVPLENLPDELHAQSLGNRNIQPNMGPIDAHAGISDLSEAFDNARLSGTAAPLPPSYATIPAAVVHSLPHYGGQGCYTLNIQPTDYINGQLVDPPPGDFNPRPSSSPGTPTVAGWVP